MKILFPVVRYADTSSILAPFVKNMARAFDAEIHVLWVEPLMDQFLELRLKESNEWLDQFIAEHFADYPIEKGKIVPGDPAAEILKYIRENQIDNVIIGTHGTKGASVAFGSVAKEIVSKSPVPVLTINTYRLSKDFKKRNTEYLINFFKNKRIVKH